MANTLGVAYSSDEESQPARPARGQRRLYTLFLAFGQLGEDRDGFLRRPVHAGLLVDDLAGGIDDGDEQRVGELGGRAGAGN